jgi:hypothetical protein
MPTTLKFLLYLTAASVFLLACMFFVEKPAAQQHEAYPQQVQGWVTESMVELEKAAAEVGSERRSPEYEACARAVRDDYSDDPVKAYWWVRTVCHR